MSKKIMILGASILQLPAIEKAKEMVLSWTPSQELNLMIIGANTQVPPNTEE